MACLKCGDTGFDSDGNPCDKCNSGSATSLPVIFEIPEQYQSSMFDKSFLPNWLLPAYGIALQEIVDTVKRTYEYKRNVLVCAPPNSGKTVFAYTIERIMLSANLAMPPIYDMNEVRKIMGDIYNKGESYNLFVKSQLAIVKIPMDVPTKFVEIMNTIMDLRLRNSGATIFLYDGTKEDLENIDRYDKFEYLVGDGSYHTVKVHSYFKPREKKEKDEDFD